MKKPALLFFLLISFNCFAQKRNAVWCFGDSALIDFNDTSNIVTGISNVKSRGSCVSICDTSGNLLFYAYTRPGVAGNSTLAFNSTNQLIQFSDSIVGEAWYHELIAIPFPDSTSFYYLFSIGVTGSSQKGLYYSTIDMNANNGQGQVLQKNVQLQSFKPVDCLTAVKHGNGRDWWIIFRKIITVPLTPNNEFHSYLITPNGVTNYTIQNAGSLMSTDLGQISFNLDGSKMVFVNYKGLLELYDFDRCSGVISNPTTIYQQNAQFPWPQRWSAEFSPSGNILYETHIGANPPDSCYLVQYDLTSSNIAGTADTLWRTPFMMNMGQLKLAPDGKIYQTNNYYGGYPYSDTTYNIYNSYLSVINSPDSLGMACNLQPYSFYLGGKRTYYGLPNNPNYDLGPLVGSGCDTLTGVPSIKNQVSRPELYVTYISSWNKVFINAQNIKGKNCLLEVFDLNGKKIFSSAKKTQPPYFTEDVSSNGIANGMYVVKLTTEKEVLSGKFVKE